MKKKFTLLLVDDERNVLKSLKRLLADSDYHILTAPSGAEGLRLFKEHEIHLVVSDYRMPDMNGVEFLSQVKQEHPDTVRMVISGYADASAVVEAINEGEIYRFIPKPWNDQDLLTTISSCFEHYELRLENARLYEELKRRYEELEFLSKGLEEKVTERTEDLKMQNRALEVTHRMIDDLPVGVLGIDSNDNIVYMNNSLQHFIKINDLSLGNPARGSLDPGLLEVIHQAVSERKSKSVTVDPHRSIAFVCKPLGGDRGAIGLFCYSDIALYTGRAAEQRSILC